MSAIRPVLIAGLGDHTALRAALRERGFGAMLAPNVQQATRLLRNFRVDVIVCVSLPTVDIRKLATKAPAVVIGRSEADAWSAGAAGFVEAGVAPASATEVVSQVSRGGRRVRNGRGIA